MTFNQHIAYISLPAVTTHANELLRLCWGAELKAGGWAPEPPYFKPCMLFTKLNYCVNEYGINENIRCSDIKKQLTKSIA